eukprot:7909718-Pyramimonas_sp.AAC.1
MVVIRWWGEAGSRHLSPRCGWTSSNAWTCGGWSWRWRRRRGARTPPQGRGNPPRPSLGRSRTGTAPASANTSSLRVMIVSRRAWPARA